MTESGAGDEAALRPDAPVPTVTHGFLFADLRGYTRYVDSHGDHAAADCSIAIGAWCGVPCPGGGAGAADFAAAEGRLDGVTVAAFGVGVALAPQLARRARDAIPTNPVSRTEPPVG